jgi:hypothetical protein
VGEFPTDDSIIAYGVISDKIGDGIDPTLSLPPRCVIDYGTRHEH